MPRGGDLAEALYVSVVSLSTVGYAEIVPSTPLIRFVAAAQAIAGSACSPPPSWILQTYPALSRRRALVHELTLFRQAAPSGHIDTEHRYAAELLEKFVTSVANVSMDRLEFNGNALLPRRAAKSVTAGDCRPCTGTGLRGMGKSEH